MKLRIDQHRQGDTLIEVVFALAILAIVLTVLTSAAVGAWRTSRLAGERTQASAYAQEQSEAIKAFHRGVDPAVFASSFGLAPANTVRCMAVVGSSWQPVVSAPGATLPLDCQAGAYSREITSITAVGTSGLYEVRIKVTWRSVGSNGLNSTDQVLTVGQDS